jgi:hypothetical protein
MIARASAAPLGSGDHCAKTKWPEGVPAAS